MASNPFVFHRICNECAPKYQNGRRLSILCSNFSNLDTWTWISLALPIYWKDKQTKVASSSIELLALAREYILQHFYDTKWDWEDAICMWIVGRIFWTQGNRWWCRGDGWWMSSGWDQVVTHQPTITQYYNIAQPTITQCTTNQPTTNNADIEPSRNHSIQCSPVLQFIY